MQDMESNMVRGFGLMNLKENVLAKEVFGEDRI